MTQIVPLHDAVISPADDGNRVTLGTSSTSSRTLQGAGSAADLASLRAA
jgi:hypothetical protein